MTTNNTLAERGGAKACPIMDWGRQRLFIALEGTNRVKVDALAAEADVGIALVTSELKRLCWKRFDDGTWRRPTAPNERGGTGEEGQQAGQGNKP